MVKLTCSIGLYQFYDREKSKYDFHDVEKNLISNLQTCPNGQRKLIEAWGYSKYQIEIRKDSELLATLNINKNISPFPEYIEGVQPEKPKPKHIPGVKNGIASDSPFAVDGNTTVDVLFISNDDNI